jgi:hypothetical protein
VPFGQEVWFQDFMGCFRAAAAPQHGRTEIPLTPAPLFIHAGDAAALVQELQRLDHDDLTLPIDLSILPAADGALTCIVKNRTGATQAGRLAMGTADIAYNLGAGAEQVIGIETGHERLKPGTVVHWQERATVAPQHGESVEFPLGLDYLLIPKAADTIDWSAVPAVRMAGRFGEERNGSIDATVRMAWSRQNLRIRVDVDDDVFLAPANDRIAAGRNELPPGDGHLELYLDTGSNGRARKREGLDPDDYRYDFLPPASGQTGRGRVRRVVGVYHQLADGTNMPTAEQVSDSVPCDFERTSKGYAMTITLDRRFLLPIDLKEGATFGIGIVVHDLDRPLAGGQAESGAVLAVGGSAPAFREPSKWPVAVLAP